MFTYCQKTQDAADELQLFAVNTGEIYAELLRAQRRTRDRFKADPNITIPEAKHFYIRFYRIAEERYRAEIGTAPQGFTGMAVHRCAAQTQAAEDLDELKTNPQAFDFITNEAIKQHRASYARR